MKDSEILLKCIQSTKDERMALRVRVSEADDFIMGEEEICIIDKKILLPCIETIKLLDFSLTQIPQVDIDKYGLESYTYSSLMPTISKKDYDLLKENK